MTDGTVQYLSQGKMDELNTELKKLKEETIPELATRIDEAKQLGDLSENAEYHAARDEMAWAQSRVKEIQMILDDSVLISSEVTGTGAATVGSTITVETKGNEREYTIVGAQEADPLSGKISNESPLGAAFLGRKKGDTVQVKVPSGTQEYTIVSVS